MKGAFLNPTEALEQAHLHEGMKVVDVGAGSGFFTRAAARLVGDHGTVWAVDIHRDMLPRLKNLANAEGLRNVEVIQGDIEHTGGTHLPSEHFDFCILSNVLFSANHKKEAVGEIKRLLTRGGRALIIDWTGAHGGLGPHPSRVFTGAEAKTLFEDGGLRVVEDIDAGAFHWGFIVRKKGE